MFKIIKKRILSNNNYNQRFKKNKNNKTYNIKKLNLSKYDIND